MMLIDVKFKIGDEVYLVTDKEQLKRTVSSFVVTNSTILYQLSQGTEVSIHEYFEISLEKDVLITSSN